MGSKAQTRPKSKGTVAARDKVQAAKLRRVPDRAFLREANRRGYERYDGRTWVATDTLEFLVRQMGGATEAIIDGGEMLGAVRVLRHVERELREYLKISEALDRRRRGEAGAA